VGILGGCLKAEKGVAFPPEDYQYLLIFSGGFAQFTFLSDVAKAKAFAIVGLRE